jgi:predicted transcriptional regulator
MSTTALQNVWNTILGFNLTTENKRWIAEHLIEQVEAETKEQLKPYTMEEINARIDRSEADIAAGRVYTREEMSQMMKEFVAQYE